MRSSRDSDGLEVVSGTSIPPGKRGFMFNTLNYERQAKNKTARRLDQTLISLQTMKFLLRNARIAPWQKQNRTKLRIWSPRWTRTRRPAQMLSRKFPLGGHGNPGAKLDQVLQYETRQSSDENTPVL